MAVEIKMPKMGVSMTTGVVVKWLKAEGDIIKKGDEVLEIETEKITNTVEALVDGMLLKIVAKEGSELPIGALLGLIGDENETIDVMTEKAPMDISQKEDTLNPNAEIRSIKSKIDRGERVSITPVARKIAKENGINYTLINGTGPRGRITKEDVENIIASVSNTADVVTSDPKDVIVPEIEQLDFEMIPYSGMRKVIGDNLTKSWEITPKVTHHVSADVTELLVLRRTINDDYEKKDKVSITDLLINITAKALEILPYINVSLSGNKIKVLKNINIGVAVALENGLVVPVIKNANQKSLSQISKEVKEIAKRARNNKLTKDEMTGATFTISNLGGYNSVDWFTPIINQPESAILGVGRIVETPVVVDGKIVIRSMMGFSLAFDHRVIDGAPAAEFLALIIKLLKKPYAMFV